YAGSGYAAMLGWIQLVRSTDNGSRGREFELDPLEPLGVTPHPFCWFGLTPTLFDAPSRRTTDDLDWLAHSFLAFTRDRFEARATAAPQAPAASQALSPGCGLVNDPSFDGVFSSVGLGPLSFFAGEQLTVGAAVPPPGSGTAATGFQLFINAVVVGTSNVPGTLTYTFPSSASFSTAWQALPALPAPTRASFTLSCAAPVAASFRGLSATNTKRGVLVRWRAASEVDALGFNVYRAV